MLLVCVESERLNDDVTRSLNASTPYKPSGDSKSAGAALCTRLTEIAAIVYDTSQVCSANVPT